MQCTTAKRFASDTGKVAGEYAEERQAIGFLYFPNFSIERQALQDEIIKEWSKKIEGTKGEKTCTFMMGAPGSGKSTEAARIASAYKDYYGSPPVIIDVDWFKDKLPEFRTFPRHLASGVVHREAGLLAALAQRRAERDGCNIVIDNASANVEWLAGELERLRERGYRLELVRTVATRATCLERCGKRGRHVPRFVVTQIHVTLNKAFMQVRDQFDRVRVVHT
jgi:adenylate kinase family enzyme